jgi:hypothetical protein
MLALPKLVITPPSREPTPQLLIAPADWERYPGITIGIPPPPPPKPKPSSRPPSYRPPPPPAEPFDLPTPTLERFWVSGRARGAGWAPASEATSPIHDAADDAYMAAFGEKFEYDYSEEKEGEKAAEKYAAFTSAYAHVHESGWRQRQRRGSRPPPPVRPLDLPGSPGARAAEVECRHEVKRHRRGNGWWSIGKW